MADGILQTIKEYLVGLGFSVDQHSYNEMQHMLKEADHSIAKFAGTAGKEFALAGAAVVGFVVAANVGIAKFIGDMGNAEIETEKLSRQLWTTEQAARSFDLSLKAMHANLQDLYLSPTLMKQFYALRQEAQQLALPSDYKQTMGEIQSIQFEFKRMKLEVSYFLREVGYYFVKYFNGPLTQGKKSLQDLNQWIIQHIPEMAQKTAKVLIKLVQLGQSLAWGIKEIGTAVTDIVDMIPTDLKPLVAVFAAVGTAIMMGPFGEIAFTITALLLLLQDFYVYMHHGKSALPGLWEWLDKLYNKLKDSGAIDQLKKSFEDLVTSTDDLAKSIGKLFDKFTSDKSTMDNITAFFKGVAGFVDDISKGIDSISKWMDNQQKLQKQIQKAEKDNGGKPVALVTDNTGKTKTKTIDPSKDGWSTKLAELLGKGITSSAHWAVIHAMDIFRNSNSPSSTQQVPMTYAFPQVPGTQQVLNTYTLNQTNHIVSPDPKAAGKEVANQTGILFRNHRSVVK